MSDVVGALMDRLTEGGSVKLVNFRVTRGTDHTIDEREMVAEIIGAIDRRNAGITPVSFDPPRSLKPTVDVRDLVREMG